MRKEECMPKVLLSEIHFDDEDYCEIYAPDGLVLSLLYSNGEFTITNISMDLHGPAILAKEDGTFAWAEGERKEIPKEP